MKNFNGKYSNSIERPQSLGFREFPFLLLEPHNASLSNIEYNMYGNLDLSAIAFMIQSSHYWANTHEMKRYFNITNFSLTKFQPENRPVENTFQIFVFE